MEFCGIFVPRPGISINIVERAPKKKDLEVLWVNMTGGGSPDIVLVKFIDLICEGISDYPLRHTSFISNVIIVAILRVCLYDIVCVDINIIIATKISGASLCTVFALNNSI